MKLNLQQVTGSSLTVLNDGNFSATTASPNSDLAKDAKATLTITANSGYELDEIEVIAGGCTIENDSGTWKVKMGESNATVFVKGKKNNVYKVTETTYVWYNGTGTTLKKNMFLEYGKNGEITGIRCSGSEVSINADIIAQLVKDGVLVKM